MQVIYQLRNRWDENWTEFKNFEQKPLFENSLKITSMTDKGATNFLESFSFDVFKIKVMRLLLPPAVLDTHGVQYRCKTAKRLIFISTKICTLIWMYLERLFGLRCCLWLLRRRAANENVFNVWYFSFFNNIIRRIHMNIYYTRICTIHGRCGYRFRI